MIQTDKDMPLVSVIVPVYGVERYIEKCLNSIINQTYTNLDIIIVDDGTKDKSAEICEDYAQFDDRIKVFHKKNGGLSDARNFGISKASGEFITFIDSDDYIDLDYIEFLMKLVLKGYKMAICSIYFVYEKKNYIQRTGNGKELVLSGKQCIEKMCFHDEVDTAAYAKIMHRSLLDNIKFPVGKVFEDIGTIFLLFDKCSEVICKFEPKYFYVIRDNSIVRSAFNQSKLDLLEMTDRMANYVNNKYPDLVLATTRRQCYSRFSTINQMLYIKDSKYIKIRKDMIEFLMSNKELVINNPKTPPRDKVAYAALSLGFYIYKLFWIFYSKIKKGM